jgi:hypothetical protein
MLWASRERCGHSLKLDLKDLHTKYGTRMPIRRIAGMLRRGRCRNRDARLMLTYSHSG